MRASQKVHATVTATLPTSAASVAVTASRKVLAIAKETSSIAMATAEAALSLTSAAFVAETALLKALATATETFSIATETAEAVLSSTNAAFVAALEHKMTAVVTASLLAIAIAMATNLTPSESAEVIVTPTLMPMAFATTKTIASARRTLVAFATDQVRSTSADATTSLQALAIVMAHNWTPLASAVAIALRTPMPMAFVTTWMTAWI